MGLGVWRADLCARDEDTDRRFAFYGALVLANPAPGAAIPDDFGSLDDDGISVGILCFGQLQLDCLLRQRAHLLTDDTVNVVHPWNTPVLIDVRLSHDLDPFLLQAQVWNSCGWTGCATGIATKVTITESWDEDRRPDPLNASPSEGRLECTCRTCADALSASYTTGEQQSFF